MNSNISINSIPSNYKKMTPAFKSKLIVDKTAYKAFEENLNESAPYIKEGLLKGTLKFLKGMKAVHKEFGWDGIKAYKNQCFGLKPNCEALISIVTKRFNDVTAHLNGETRLFGTKQGSMTQLGVEFTKDGLCYDDCIGKDMPTALLPMYPKKDVVDYCVKNLLDRTARALDWKSGNEFDIVKNSLFKN